MRKKEWHLPKYTEGEELINMISHIVGGVFGIVVLLMCVIKSSLKGDIYAIVGSVIYGISMITLYTMSSVYHGLKPGMAKKIMRILDHCAIYLLIAGTTTPVAMVAIRAINPLVAWIFLGVEWGFAIIAIIFNAIDLKKFAVFAMICNLFMGWAVIFIWKIAIQAMSYRGFMLMLIGGIIYTVGAIIYGLGKKQKYMHSLFHIFVLLGSFLQFISIYKYVL
ncbi:MAG: hemolysin III family protein [Christensenellaceae bacterium]|nr:hemolysin III family protein [Christensenellaceae bacterium]